MARYEPVCMVSDLGRVKSRRRFSQSGNRYYGGKLLKPVRMSNDYRSVNLGAATNGRQISIHRAVLETFVGPCPSGMEGCHYDGDRSNNKLSNLRWDTRSENIKDVVRHQRQRGINNPLAKLTDAAVHSIRTNDLPDDTWAERLGVEPSTVKQARCGRTWKHVPTAPVLRQRNWRPA